MYHQQQQHNHHHQENSYGNYQQRSHNMPGFHGTDRKQVNRQMQESATQRKAANDTQYFWDLVQRHSNGQNVKTRKPSRDHEEHHLFTKKANAAAAEGNPDLVPIDDSIAVQRSGPQSDEVEALESFEELNGKVPSSVLICFEKLHFDKPTVIQRHALPLALQGHDLMCCAQTGSGKTFAFLVPVVTALDPSSNQELTESAESGGQPQQSNSILNRCSVDERGVLPLAIVLAPTRELASQIHIDARRLTFHSDIRSVCVYGGNDIRNQLVELCAGCELIVATPGRLNDLVERGVVSLSQVKVLVLDEADRMLDMGFEPQIRRIVLDYDMPSKEARQTFLFSATFPSEIQTLAREFLRQYVWIAVGRVGSTVEHIQQRIVKASPDPNDKISLLINALNDSDGRTLVFVQKKKTATWLCDCLRSAYGISVDEIHGDRSQAQRENALKMFRDGHTRILIATDVAARGLDVPAVKHVIQFDMPISPEDFDVYVHRIGRTGRAGNTGIATSFFVPGREVGEGNGKIAPQLMQLLQENNQNIPDWFAELDDLHSSGHGSNGYGQNRRSGYNNSQQGYNNRSRFGYHDQRSNQISATYTHQGGNYDDRNGMQNRSAYSSHQQRSFDNRNVNHQNGFSGQNQSHNLPSTSVNGYQPRQQQQQAHMLSSKNGPNMNMFSAPVPPAQQHSTGVNQPQSAQLPPSAPASTPQAVQQQPTPYYSGNGASQPPQQLGYSVPMNVGYGMPPQGQMLSNGAQPTMPAPYYGSFNGNYPVEGNHINGGHAVPMSYPHLQASAQTQWSNGPANTMPINGTAPRPFYSQGMDDRQRGSRAPFQPVPGGNMNYMNSAQGSRQVPAGMPMASPPINMSVPYAPNNRMYAPARPFGMQQHHQQSFSENNQYGHPQSYGFDPHIYHVSAPPMYASSLSNSSGGPQNTFADMNQSNATEDVSGTVDQQD